MGLFTDEDVHLLKSLIDGKIKELEDIIEVERAFERDKIIEGSQRMIFKYRTFYKKLET